MSKIYNLRLIKTRESYSTKRISQELGVHPRTVQEWYKEGLLPIENKPPYRTMGYVIKKFLEKKLQKHKCQLQPEEFYCTKCRHAVRSTDNDVWIEISKRTIGISRVISWIFINRFSHTGKIEEIKQTFNVVEIGEQNND